MTSGMHYSNPVNAVALTALVFVQVVFVTMVYGPYHIGSGWFGGFLPIIATSLVVATGNIYAGLAFPIVVALVTVVVGSTMLRDRHNESIWAEVRE